MKTFLLSLFISLSLPALAQNTGFAGKRILVKLDAYNSYVNRFPSFGVELVATRSLTLSADVQMGTQSVKQIYYFPHPEDHIPTTLEGSHSKEKMSDKALVDHTTAVFSLRKYFGKEVIPAPYGAFFSAGFRKGVIREIRGRSQEGFFEDNISNTGEYFDYTAKNISYYGIQAGFGGQIIIFSRVSLDFLAGLNYNRFDMNLGPVGNQVVSGATGNFGPNVWRIYTNKDKRDVKSYNFGLFLNVNVGILLF